jgi:hypothetical protein
VKNARSGYYDPNLLPGDTAAQKAPDASLDMRGENKIAIGLQMLCNKTPVQFKQIIGNRNFVPNADGGIDSNQFQTLDSGMVTINARGGNLGFATEISDDCDYVAIDLVLYAAQSADNFVGEVGRQTGRWLTQYRLTAMERLSREEWETIVNQTNLSILYRSREEIA